jgi:N-dimethylarginine dimethylaminohydrolase
MSDTPATFGGPGWRTRKSSHAEDVHAGQLWHSCGVWDEYSRLESVLISQPSQAFEEPGDPEAWLMLSWPDLAQLRSECAAIQAFFRAQGVEVHVHNPAEPPPPNYLFMRDLVFMTPEGAIVGRPASPARAGEARFAQAALADLGIPIIGSMRGHATMEGADCLWLDAATVLVGEGIRTNAEGVRCVAETLAPMGVSVRTVKVPPGAQHLLGVVVPLDRDLAVVDGARISSSLVGLLADQGIRTIAVPADDENRGRRGMNGVVLGPREWVMPSGCPGIRSLLDKEGVKVHELQVDAYVQAAGALGCLTAVIRRKRPPAR